MDRSSTDRTAIENTTTKSLLLMAPQSSSNFVLAIPLAQAAANTLATRSMVRVTPNGWRVSGELRGEAEERVRCTRGLGGLSIHVFAIGDSHDEHHQFSINY
jgi:hypothetical protein